MSRLIAFVLSTAFVSWAGLAAAESLKAGWTDEMVAKEAEACTEMLVQGAWDNTKREQGADAALPLTAEIREHLAPQIAKMKKLCGCVMRAGAKRYTKAEADASPAELDRFMSETIAKGTCKLEP
jgi:hypothetical protein